MTPGWSRVLLSWDIWAAMSALSLLLLGASALAIPWLVRRIRADYLVRPSLPPPARLTPRHIALRVCKNLVGLLLFVLGIAMLALPGQGILTMAVALLMLDLPGKRWLLSRLIAMPPLLHAINTLRRRGNAPPLTPPPTHRHEP